MSHINSHLDAPLHPDRGRRLLPTPALYQHPTTGDYLHDHRPPHQQTTPPIGTRSTPNPLRFHRGFYRRSEAAIGVGEARRVAEAERERRCEEVGRQRRVVLGERQKECEAERELMPRRRHFLDRHTATSLACPAPPATQPLPATPLLPAFVGTSRIIGASKGGANDTLGSYGVLDAFMGDGYGRADWQPKGRRENGKREERVVGGGGCGGGEVKSVDVDGLNDARRQRQVEYVRNARQGSQLQYLFGSSAERSQSV